MPDAGIWRVVRAGVELVAAGRLHPEIGLLADWQQTPDALIALRDRHPYTSTRALNLIAPHSDTHGTGEEPVAGQVAAWAYGYERALRDLPG